MEKATDRSKWNIVLPAMALGLFVSTSMAQGAKPARYPMSSAVVAQSLKTNGLDVEPSEVHLPMILSASSPSPNLEITATERLTDGRVRLQLRCRTAGECVPFNATLDVRSAAAVVAEAGLKSSTVSELTAMSRYVEMQPTARSEPSSPSAIAHAGTTATLHAGSKAVLVFQDQHMTIHLPVIAIDSGATGADVRVCTPDRKKTFRATVMDQATVRGVMQ
jgi:flagella basal body P-ring formation protein FlgA